MVSSSLSNLCDGVEFGLRYAGISTGRRISFLIPPDLRERRLAAPEKLSNFLNLLFTWILTETEFPAVVMEWEALGEDRRGGLRALVRLQGREKGDFTGDLRLFPVLSPVCALLEDLGGNISSAFPQLLEMRIFPPREGTSREDSSREEDSPESPIEIDQVIRDLGEPSFCIDVIDEYMDSTRNLIEKLEAGLAARDTAAVHRIAHTIKGGAFSIRASRLRGTASALEQEAKAGRLENGAFYLARIRDEYKNASRYFSQIRNEYRYGNKKNPLR